MDGNMRRLPPWMIAGASSVVTSSDAKNVEGKSKHEPEAPKTKAEKRRRRTVKPKERDDSKESKKVGTRRKRVRSKIEEEEEESKPSNGDGENPEIMRAPKDEDLTVDDLLSFAQEYVKDQARKEPESLSISESNMTSSQVETKEPKGTRDPKADDMLHLLLGPFFNKP